MTTLTLTQITGSLCRAWHDAIGETVPTIYPSMFVNTEGWPAWYELMMDSWNPHMPRTGDPIQGDVRVTVTVCVKPGTDLQLGQVLVEQARSVFSGQAIVVNESASDPTLGRIRFGEARVENQSAKATHPAGQLWLLQWTGEVLAEQ